MHRNHFLLILIFFLPVTARAQLIFQNIKQQDGLSEKQITCLFKDSEGMLWIGTHNRLNRFDGAVIRQYPNNGGPNNLSITAIIPFKNENYLLIGTHTGIRLFNKMTGSFIQDKEFQPIAHEHIELIRVDEYKRFWIVTTSKIFIYQNGKLYPGEELIPSLRAVQNPQFYYSGFLWDKKRKGFWVGGKTTYFINCLTNEVYYKQKNPKNYPVLDNGNVEAIALDRNYNVWYGCNNDLALRFWDYQRNTVKSYGELSGKKVNDGYNMLFIDNKDRLWISTWSFAAYVKEPGKSITKVPYSQDQNYSIAYGHFRDVIQDDEGNIWFGTINGVSKMQENSPIRDIIQVPSFEFYLETGFAQSNSICVDNDLVMCAKEEGILALNLRSRQYKRYMVTSDKKELVRNRFVSVAKAGDQWWFAGIDGIYFLDRHSDRLVRFEQVKKGHPTRYVNFVFADHNDNIWFHIPNDAVYRYNPRTRVCIRFDGQDKAYGAFKYRTLQSFIVLRNGDLIFGMNEAGLLKFDSEKEHFSVIPVQDPKNFYLRGMAEDHSNNIWVAPYGKGLVKLDKNGHILDSLNITNGLLLDQINAMGIDGRGAIWASSREGLAFVDPILKKETRVQLEIGKTLEDYWNYLTVANGKVYAVMLDHIVVIDPFRFEAIPVKKPPLITSVKIFENEKINGSPDEELSLKAGEDYISFQYASLNHRDVPSLLYSYQLEGVDANWVNAGRSLSASYNKLPHGHYTFNIRSTDEHGKWMKTITSFKFYVEPYWWQSWWAYLGYLTLGILALVVAYKSYKKRKQKRVIEETIDYFANSVYGENSVSEICWDIARNCISQLHFEDCVVYLLDKDRDVLVQKATYGPKNPKGHEISNPIEIEVGEGIVGNVASTGKALIIPDTSLDPRYIVDDEVRLSEIAVPILHEGKVIGVIDSEHRKKNFYKDEHLKALSTIASISANKIAEALAEAQAQEKEIKLLEIRKMLAESQLMALRAQMNPHFVFNCLNSIQECIVTEKYSEASKYLNKFSKLFRMVLNNSGRNLVTIDEELEVLELYLQLERMRFEKSFCYQIIVDKALETDETLLPSMLVQPYVENALWHGLMHSSGKRELMIEFRLVDQAILECRIEDNGIGRKKSFELKKQNSKTKRHESKGLLISKERLDVLQRLGQHAEVHITDKYDPSGEAAGTLVVIELSAFLKND
jgi:ligand-binding sensor domain-containing protein/putative methionine-R-sulfoxide reductase with GAF domain